MIPLIMLNKNQTFKIVKIYGGRGVHKKIFDLGITFNSLCRVINNTGNGTMIIEKDGIRIGVGYGMAKKIFVRIYDKGGIKNV